MANTSDTLSNEFTGDASPNFKARNVSKDEKVVTIPAIINKTHVWRSIVFDCGTLP